MSTGTGGVFFDGSNQLVPGEQGKAADKFELSTSKGLASDKKKAKEVSCLDSKRSLVVDESIVLRIIERVDQFISDDSDLKLFQKNINGILQERSVNRAQIIQGCCQLLDIQYTEDEAQVFDLIKLSRQKTFEKKTNISLKWRKKRSIEVLTAFQSVDFCTDDKVSDIFKDDQFDSFKGTLKSYFSLASVDQISEFLKESLRSLDLDHVCVFQKFFSTLVQDDHVYQSIFEQCFKDLNGLVDTWVNDDYQVQNLEVIDVSSVRKSMKGCFVGQRSAIESFDTFLDQLFQPIENTDRLYENLCYYHLIFPVVKASPILAKMVLDRIFDCFPTHQGEQGEIPCKEKYPSNDDGGTEVFSTGVLSEDRIQTVGVLQGLPADRSYVVKRVPIDCYLAKVHFLRELTLQVRSQSVSPDVYTVFKEGEGCVSMVMEKCGPTLRDGFLANPRYNPGSHFSLYKAPLLLIQDELNRLGIDHHDLKPNNIFESFSEKGAFKLGDFGCAGDDRLLPIDTLFPKTDTIDYDLITIGTPNYMEIENDSGDCKSHNSYAFGLLSFMLMTKTSQSHMGFQPSLRGIQSIFFVSKAFKKKLNDKFFECRDDCVEFQSPLHKVVFERGELFFKYWSSQFEDSDALFSLIQPLLEMSEVEAEEGGLLDKGVIKPEKTGGGIVDQDTTYVTAVDKTVSTDTIPDELNVFLQWILEQYVQAKDRFGASSGADDYDNRQKFLEFVSKVFVEINAGQEDVKTVFMRHFEDAQGSLFQQQVIKFCFGCFNSFQQMAQFAQDAKEVAQLLMLESTSPELIHTIDESGVPLWVNHLFFEMQTIEQRQAQWKRVDLSY